MADFKSVDGGIVQLSADEQAVIDAKRAEQAAREARTDDQVAGQDYPLDLRGIDPMIRATIEVLAANAGLTPQALRALVKDRLIAANFYK